jgi:hypothetical protein
MRFMINKQLGILMLYALIGFQSIQCKAYFDKGQILDLEHNIVACLGSLCIHKYIKNQPHNQNSDLTACALLADVGWNFYNAYRKYACEPCHTLSSELFEMVCLEAFYQTTVDIGIYAATRYILGRINQYLTPKKTAPSLKDPEEISPNKEVAVTPTEATDSKGLAATPTEATEATDSKDPYMQIRPIYIYDM